MHALQVGNELAAGDASDLGTHAAQILCLTTCFDAIAHLDFLAARFTLPCHRNLYVFYWGSGREIARQYTDPGGRREAGIRANTPSGRTPQSRPAIWGAVASSRTIWTFRSSRGKKMPMDQTFRLIGKLYQIGHRLHRHPHRITLFMTAIPSRTPSLVLIWLAGAALTACGCTMVKMPAHPFTKEGSGTYVGIDSSFRSGSDLSEDVYHSVRRARAENAVVLQVEGDSTPSRLMPLPPPGKSVYLSHLLEQTGVIGKFGAIEATLFRHSADSIGGMPMHVRMTQDGKRIRPESDYALQAGDRVRVTAAPDPTLQQLVDAVFGQYPDRETGMPFDRPGLLIRRSPKPTSRSGSFDRSPTVP